MNITTLKIILTGAGASVGMALGGFDSMLTTLLILMLFDYITGVMCAIVTKTLSSCVGAKGICKKVVILLFVMLATQLDIALNTNATRYLVIAFYIANEGLSLIENAGVLGLPVPDALKKTLEQLNNK